MADLFKKIKDVVIQDEDEDDSTVTQPKRNIADIEVYDLNTFEQAGEVIYVLKHGKTSIVNIHKLDSDQAQRVLDYFVGSCYALDASLKQVGTDVFVITPKNISISGNVSK